MQNVKIIKDDIFDEKTIRCLLKSEKDIKSGRTRSAEQVFKELNEKYGFHQQQKV